MIQYFVQYNKNKKHWEVKKAKAEKALFVCKTKKECENKCTKIAKKNKGQCIVKNKKNQEFNGESTYGKDPYPPKG